VTYHPTCHSLRSIRVGDRPLALLREVRGIELVELPEFDQCCGFGGLFALKNPDTSAAMGLDKIANVIASGADVLCASDNSCLTHLSTLAKKSPSLVPGYRTDSVQSQPNFEVKHIAEILASTKEGL
jgi:L-lactate dehydrogenase complex protein LldE